MEIIYITSIGQVLATLAIDIFDLNLWDQWGKGKNSV